MNLQYSLSLMACLTMSTTTFTANAATQSTADSLLINASIYGHQQADAIAIRDGKILDIGDAEQLLHYRTSTTEVIDLEHAFVLPGFIDNHNHVFEAASEAGGNCELDMDALADEQIPYLKACRRHAKANEWLMGYGFSIDAVLHEDNRYTPLEVIDRIFPDQPVIIMEQTSHSMWVNTVALERAGINRHTPDPQGGKILKEEDTGELNGILLDNAGDLVMELAWNSLSNQFDQSYAGLLAGLSEAAAHGITTIGDGRLYWKRGWYEVWKQAEQDGELTARVSLRPWIYPTDAMAPQLDYLKRIRTQDKSGLLLVDQVKMYSDGIFVNGTAKTLAPYEDTYIPDMPYGLNYIPPQQMKRWLSELHTLGYSAHIHAIGDGAIRESLNAIEYVQHQGSNQPYTLTHVELVNPADVPRFADLGVTADFQVGSDYVAHHDHQWAEPLLGRERTQAMMNLNAIYKTGANISLSSDWNVHSINPLVGIANSLKMGDTGLPNVHVAIDAYTRNAARSLGIEDLTGTIDIGKSADFAVLEADITRMPINRIARTRFLMTILQGQVVFDADQ